MVEESQILIVDYDGITSGTLPFSNKDGYRTVTVHDNAQAQAQVNGSDLIVLITNERKREPIKLMELVRGCLDPAINFILIVNGPEDKAFLDRVDPLVFQYFRKDHCSSKELAKAIGNALEMRHLKVRERQFVHDLDRIEDELKKVEHRLYTISSMRQMVKENTFLN